MKEKDLTELIDQFLLGKIQQEELARLEYLRKSIPAVDLRVRHSLETLNAIKYYRFKLLRKNLREIDAHSARQRLNICQHWIQRSALLLLIFGALWICMINYYDPASMASRYFKPSGENFDFYSLMTEGEKTDWNIATSAFQEGHFQQARLLFQPFANHIHPEIGFSSQWNLLLARFALEGNDIIFENDLILFEATAPGPLKSQAMELYRSIKSPGYRIFALKVVPSFSALKPRLM